MNVTRIVCFELERANSAIRLDKERIKKNSNQKLADCDVVEKYYSEPSGVERPSLRSVVENAVKKRHSYSSSASNTQVFTFEYKSLSRILTAQPCVLCRASPRITQCSKYAAYGIQYTGGIVPIGCRLTYMYPSDRHLLRP